MFAGRNHSEKQFEQYKVQHQRLMLPSAASLGFTMDGSPREFPVEQLAPCSSSRDCLWNGLGLRLDLA